MKVVILGGDGFCGWPSALHLSARGFDVVIVDNLVRRAIDCQLGTASLTPIATPAARLNAWAKITGRTIGFRQFDVAEDYDDLLALLQEFEPDAVVHFAEQRAAPYSMKSSLHRRYTVRNNLNATNNILAAIVESGLNAHLVHLGSMGVYGYGSSKAKIPEGYLRSGTGAVLYPADPGSIYHMTKAQDQLLFAFYAKNDHLRITDLHQGIVWGTQTRETELDVRLINRFDYDGDFGTVLNRFLVQAAIGHPLTVYESGGQSRAFINVQDVVKCIELAIQNPPEPGERVNIFNQMTEIHRVRDLAALVSRLTGTPITYVDNPRIEANENDLTVENAKLLNLGLVPTTLNAGLLREITEVARKYSDRCDRTKIPCTSTWRAAAVPEAIST